MERGLMAGSLAPQWFMQIFDDAGDVASGSKISSYLSGTSQPTPIYADQACTVPLENPYEVNAAGRAEFWLLDGITYRLRIETADGVMLVDRSGITGSGSGGGTTTQGVTEKESFSLNSQAGTLWLQDSYGDLWDGDPSLAFRCDFVTRGFTSLRYFRSIWYANAGTPQGRFAIYGNGATKLVDEALPDSNLYGIYQFPSGLDISSYDFLSVVMDPGVSAAPQPVAQSIEAFPVSAGLGRWSFAHMVEHDHNTEFPETAPTLPDFDMKYCLARYCAIGVQ